jgi:DNA-binding transcriptional LysR family regulator
VELRHIRCAVAVAESRHFGRAAERLFITQPALSQHVRNLERELRCRLFDRSSRSVTLTPAGEVFIAGARALLQRTDALVEATRAAQVGETGTVSVGLDQGSSESYLTGLLGGWAAACGGVRPRLVSGPRSVLVDAVGSHDLDVAVVGGPVAVRWATVTGLCDLPLVVALPAGHRLASLDALGLVDIVGERLIGLSRATAPALMDRVASLYASLGLPLELATEFEETSTLRMAVAAGTGVAVVAGLGAAVPEGLAVVPLVDEGAMLPVVAVWRPDCSMQARAFVRQAVKSSATWPDRLSAFRRAPERPAC